MSISSSLLGGLQNSGKNGAASAGERNNPLGASSNESSISFSQMLRDTNKAVMPPPAPTPASAPAPAANAAPKPPAQNGEVKTESQRQETRAAGKRSGTGDTAKAPATPTARAADASRPPAGADKVDEDKTEGDDTAAARKTGEDERQVAADEVRSLAEPQVQPGTAPLIPTTTGPQILALLAKAGCAPEGAAVKPDTTAATDGSDDSDDSEERPAIATTGRGAGRTDAAQAAGRTPAAEDKTVTAAATPDFTAALQEAVNTLPQALQALKGAGPARGEGASVDGLLSASASNPGAAVNPAAVPDTPTITLAQPLYEPGFAPELAARVSLLAADGVQEAQLHLNPAEMGPVAVQIVIDGQQAQVSFHAEQADTRAALEQSLPDLAAALRDSGLTLSGGGVFQQTPGQNQASQQRQADGSGQRRGSRASSDDGGSTIARTATAPRASRGVLDLYA